MDPAEVALVRRLWLPVARIEDLPPGGVVAGQIMDTEIVLWRSSTGAVTASPAFCPHRGAFLADGHVVDDDLQCPYHGWRFRPGDGVCVLTPSSGAGATPVRTSLAALQTREKYGHIWACLGEPFLDFPSIPPLDSDEWTLACGPPRNLKCGYRQLTENFRDMAHFAFVHTGSMGPNVIKEVPRYQVERDGFDLRWDVPTNLGGTALQAREAVAGRQDFHYRLAMPSIASIETRFPAGGRRVTAQFAVPADREGRACRQFWFVAIDSTVRDEHGVSIEEMFEFEAKIFNEDVPIVERQRPSEAPLDGKSQAHSPADRYSLVYREAYRDLMAAAAADAGARS
jgi:phenylpropionate dioxygenase-like ring-hydroxylating dioxygenase large terminal subunit